MKPFAKKSAYLDEFIEGYNENSAYSLDSSLTAAWYPHRIIDQTQSGSMLELGIGHGRAVAMFGQYFDPHVVVEGSLQVIDHFRTKFPDARSRVEHSYFEDFTTDTKFDVISMGFVLEHVNDPVMILKRFSRFLGDSGVLYIAVPNATSLHRRLGFLAGLMPDIKALGAGDLRLGHKRYYDIQSLRDDVADSGLTEVALEGIFLKPFTSAQLGELQLPTEVLDGLMIIGKDYPELCNSILMSVVRKSC